MSAKVSIRYATSFLGASVEKKILDKVSSDFELVSDAFVKSPELSRLMKSPIIKPELKKSVITEIFKDKISKDSLDYLLFVIEKNREDLLEEILQKFFELRDDYLGIAKIQVTTSFEFTEEQKTQLKEKFSKLLNKKINLTFSVDDKLIGGFIAKAGDTIYDASVFHQLELLKKQFMQGGAALN